MDRKARIILKEGTGAMVAYGSMIFGYIKDVAEVAKNRIESSITKGSEKLLFIIDEYGERFLIPCEDVRSIKYE